jgi:hypothetical protein
MRLRRPSGRQRQAEVNTPPCAAPAAGRLCACPRRGTLRNRCALRAYFTFRELESGAQHSPIRKRAAPRGTAPKLARWPRLDPGIARKGNSPILVEGIRGASYLPTGRRRGAPVRYSGSGLVVPKPGPLHFLATPTYTRRSRVKGTKSNSNPKESQPVKSGGWRVRHRRPARAAVVAHALAGAGRCRENARR